MPPASKLNRLLELCTGKAYAAIKSCAVSKDAVEAYARARKLLKTRFGDDYVISEAMVKKIVHGPEIRQNNADAIQDFTDSVRDCVETLHSMDRLAEVDTRSRLVELVRRLPEQLRNRWRKKAVQDRDENGSYPTITTFLQFLEGVCRELNDPMFGDFTVAASTETKRKPDKKKGQTLLYLFSFLS